MNLLSRVISYFILILTVSFYKIFNNGPHLSYSCSILRINCPQLSQFNLTKESYFDNKYTPLVKHFQENFVKGYDIGSSFAFYYKGKLIMDIAAGYQDYSFTKPYKHNNLQMINSATKNLCTLSLAILVDRGYINYEDKISSFWTEFGVGNKENVTVADLAQHSAGLAYLEDEHKVTMDELKDLDKLSSILARQSHNYGGVKKLAYHVQTYGHYINEVVRRLDPKKRTLGAFIQEEINIPLKTDFKFVLSEEEFKDRYAPLLEYPNITLIFKLVVNLLFIDPIKSLLGYEVHSGPVKEFFIPGSQFQKAARFFNKDFAMDFTNHYITHSVEMPSFNGVSNAGSLAKIAGLIANQGEIDGVRLLREETVNKAVRLLQPQFDQALKQNGHIKAYGGWGYGNATNTPVITGNTSYMGWGGLGGSLFGFNTEKNFGIAYVMNAMGDTSLPIDHRGLELVNKFYELMEKLEK